MEVEDNPGGIVKGIFLVHLASTLFMVGIIWFVQVVHYPLFAAIGTTDFPGYEELHVTKTTWVVLPPMVLELFTGGLLLFLLPNSSEKVFYWLGFFLIIGIWASTFLIQVPYHDQLRMSLDSRIVDSLVYSNWIRTTLWSVRGFMLICLAGKAMK